MLLPFNLGGNIWPFLNYLKLSFYVVKHFLKRLNATKVPQVKGNKNMKNNQKANNNGLHERIA